MRKSRVIAVAVIITAAVLLSARGVAAPSPAGDWGARVGMSLRAAWNGSRHPGAATMLSSAKVETGRARVFVVFDGQPTAVPGFRMVSQSGGVATGVLELEALPALASLPNVRYISAERVFYPTDDPGVVSVRAPRTRTRLGATGKGVLLGIIDTGIDWTHPDFLDSQGNTRIEAILDLSEPPESLGPGELGEPGPYGGIVVYREMIDAALGGRGKIRQKDYVGHGTHVAGTAAASPSGDTLNSLGGVAPGVSIVAIKVSRTPRDSSLGNLNIIHGIVFLDSLAWVRGMPAVANLSLGGALGSHDGTDPLELDLEGFIKDYRSKDYRRGRAIVVSSGNSRSRRAHASGDFFSTGADSTVLELNLTGGQGGDNVAHIQIWLSKNHRGVNVEIFSPDGVVKAWIDDGDSLVAVTDAGVIWAENARGGVHPLAGDRVIEIILADKGATDLDTSNVDAQLAPGTWRLVMRPAEGTAYSSGDAWDAYVYSNHRLGARFASHVDETGTVNVPGTAEGVITAGAYNVRTGWWSLSGGAGSLGVGLGTTTPGELTYFTSLGPTRDGRLKPEITAPGRWVMSSLSGNAWPLTETLSIFPSLLFVAGDSAHGVSQGTSFSAPHVAGVVALLLEVDSTLTSAELKTLITSTAAIDSQTVGAPDNYWGYGRVNAAGAVAKALGFQSGLVLLSAALNPPDTLAADSLRYSVSVDFSASLQSLTSCRLRVTWPPEMLRLRGAPDTLSVSGTLRLAAELDSLSHGVLNLNATAIGFTPDRYDLVSLAFRPVRPEDADSVLVGFELLSIGGDLGGADLLGALSVTQAGPLSLRLEDVCLVAGDLDGNGALDVFDLLEMLKVISGKREESLCSDLDGSGGTDIFDLLVQLNRLGGK